MIWQLISNAEIMTRTIIAKIWFMALRVGLLKVNLASNPVP
jgi:hypothetical protein